MRNKLTKAVHYRYEVLIISCQFSTHFTSPKTTFFQINITINFFSQNKCCNFAAILSPKGQKKRLVKELDLTRLPEKTV